MSTLLNVYIDIELKISTRDKDSSEIAAKILAALYIYLSKFSSKNYISYKDCLNRWIVL